MARLFTVPRGLRARMYLISPVRPWARAGPCRLTGFLPCITARPSTVAASGRPRRRRSDQPGLHTASAASVSAILARSTAARRPAPPARPRRGSTGARSADQVITRRFRLWRLPGQEFLVTQVQVVSAAATPTLTTTKVDRCSGSVPRAAPGCSCGAGRASSRPRAVPSTSRKGRPFRRPLPSSSARSGHRLAAMCSSLGSRKRLSASVLAFGRSMHRTERSSESHRAAQAKPGRDTGAMFEGFASTFVDTGDASIFVRHGGDGPAVLLLHGHPRRRRPGIGSRPFWSTAVSPSSARICVATGVPRSGADRRPFRALQTRGRTEHACGDAQPRPPAVQRRRPRSAAVTSRCGSPWTTRQQ